MKEYPKIIKFNRITLATGKIEPNLSHKVKNQKEEFAFYNIVASQRSNFKYDIKK
jgi:hypothetical protein